LKNEIPSKVTGFAVFCDPRGTKRKTALDPETALNEAAAALKRGNADLGLACAGKAVQLAPDDSAALTLLGIAQIEAKQADCALVPLQKARRLRPDDHLVPLVQSFALEATGQLADALASARDAAAMAASAASLSPSRALSARGTNS
jgi:Flp pilus assembly protein TadD